MSLRATCGTWALASALQPTLHVFEVTLRNAIFTTSVKLVDARGLRMPDIPCWLDARDSTLLYARGADEVARAKTSLGSDPRRRTPGHLVARLTFGFWGAVHGARVQRTPGRSTQALAARAPLVFPFRWPPGSRRLAPTHADRETVYTRLHQIRELRNRIAHHAPIWDRELAAEHERILEVLAWMSRRMADAVVALDRFPRVLAEGPGAYRAQAERLLTGRAPPAGPSAPGHGSLQSRL